MKKRTKWICRGVLFLSLLLLCVPAIAATTWQQTGGRGSIVAIDPNNSQTIYAGGSSTGVFKSTDGGATWNAANNGLTNTAILALVIDPINSQNIYVGTDWGGGIFKSTDGGGTWSAENNGLPQTNIQSLAIDPTNTQIIYAGTAYGVYKSTGGGSSWSAANGGLTMSAGSLAIDPTNSQTIYAGIGGGVLKSTDGGGSWSTLNTGLPTIIAVYSLAIDPTSSQNIYAATGSGVLKSTNGGGSWNAIGFSSTFMQALTLDPTNSQTIYAGTSLGGVYKSVDGGGSWSAINSPWYMTITSLIVDPTNNQTIYVGANGPVYKGGIFPTISGTPASRATTGTGFSFTPTATNATSFSISNKPSWASFNTTTGALTGTTTNSNLGVYSNIQISAINSTWTVSLAAFSITVMLPMPTISGIPTTKVITGNAYSFNPTATNASSFSITNKPSWASFDTTTGALIGTPTILGTSSNIIISATNSTGTASLPAFTITVAPPVPTISGTPATNVTSGNVYSFAPTATDASSFNVTNKPTWATFDTSTGSLIGTPANANAGAYSNIIISASNSSGQASLSAFTITVALPMPTIGGTPTSSVTLGNAYSFTPTTTSATSFSITGSIPPGLNFNTTTGTLSGTPTTIGTYSNIAISATNNTGTVFLPVFSITVALPLPTISGTPATSVTSGNAYNFNPVATNATSFSISSKPSWANFDTSTGAFTGTPTNANVGNFNNIVISATNSTGTTSLPAFSIAVVLPMPTISGTPSTSGTTGSTYSFTPTATNANGFSISNMPFWANFNTSTGALTGTPTIAGTFTNIVISATNSTGTVSLVAFSIGVATLPDTTAPVVSEFTIPATSTSVVVPVTTLTATDNVGVTAYLLTESPTAPSAGASGWVSSAPASYAFSVVAQATPTSKTLYAWAKDTVGNVSISKAATVTITLPDTTAPIVAAFTIPATSATLVVPVTTLTATDNVGVTGYLLTDTSTAPSVGATGWSSTAPTSYTFSTAGSKTLYAWAKDAAGNASTSLVATVTVDATGPSLTLSTLADGAITNNSTLNISGTVSDPDGVAAVTINNASVKHQTQLTQR